MTTSGTTGWSLNRDNVINGALRKLGVLSGGSTPKAFEVTAASEALNAMIKGFQADGMPVWAMRRYSFAPTAGVGQYTIGVGQTINTPAPLKITQAVRVMSGNLNAPLNIYTQNDFALLPINAKSAPPVNLYYQPLNETGRINLWPVPSADCLYITITYQRPFEDMNMATDDFDFPPFWTEALIYGLAWRLAPEYGTPAAERMAIKQEAEYFHQYALSFGTEEGSLYLMPDWAGRK